MNADGMSFSASKPAISMVEELGSNLAPPPAPPKGNKRKNHRGGRKTKKKQKSSTGQDPRTAPNDLAATITVETTVPALAKKQKQMKGKRCRKSAKPPTETAIVATGTITERQDDVAIHSIKDDCGSPTAPDEPTSACHSGANSSIQDLYRSGDVDEVIGTRAETCEADSAVEQESVSIEEGASGDITICGGDAFEAGFESVDNMAETSQGKY